ncbi:hypothetical protein K523DRAFT_125494 [Schizophyllum commune Tattone D]|nr:hypothetical protein K523DRAFT_125494 [Schizophyllum commune Tattone D]
MKMVYLKSTTPVQNPLQFVHEKSQISVHHNRHSFSRGSSLTTCVSSRARRSRRRKSRYSSSALCDCNNK